MEKMLKRDLIALHEKNKKEIENLHKAMENFSSNVDVLKYANDLKKILNNFNKK
jgi:hypothetical protein